MSETVIVALISLAGVIITAVWQNKRLSIDFEKHSEMADQRLENKLTTYSATTDLKIDALTKEVREHNHFARRVPILEEKVKTLEEASKK